MEHTFTFSRDDYASFQRQVGKVLRRTMPRSWGFFMQMAVWLFVGLAISTYLQVYERALDYRGPLVVAGGLIVLAAVGFILAQVVSGRMVPSGTTALYSPPRPSPLMTRGSRWSRSRA